MSQRPLSAGILIIASIFLFGCQSAPETQGSVSKIPNQKTGQSPQKRHDNTRPTTGSNARHRSSELKTGFFNVAGFIDQYGELRTEKLFFSHNRAYDAGSDKNRMKSYIFSAYGSGGEKIGDFGFDVSGMTVIGPDGSQKVTEGGTFSFSFPADTPLSKIVISKGRKPLFSQERSLNRPDVSFLSPDTDGTLMQDFVVSWTGSDADSDPIGYAFNSFDASGRSLGISFPANGEKIRIGDYKQGKYTLRIYASDGLSTSYVDRIVIVDSSSEGEESH